MLRQFSWSLAALITIFTAADTFVARASDVIGEIRTYKTSQGENLLVLSRQKSLGLLELMAVNPGVDPYIPADGSKLILPTAHILPDAPRQGIVANIAELRMFYYPPNGGPVATFAIGVGRDGFKIPYGQTRVVRKAERPTWYPTANTRRDRPELPAAVPPGPENPLGEYALYLGWPTYLMHGTNMPDGVGRRVSRGCVRMYPEDVEWLYQRTPVGTQVVYLSQPVKMGWRGGELFLEVAPSAAQVDEIEEEGIAKIVPVKENVEPQRFISAAGEQARRLDWDAIAWALTHREGIPVQITR